MTWMGEQKPGSTTGTISSGWLTIAGIAMLTNPGAVVGVIAPTVADAFVQRGFPLPVASLLGAAELGGMTVALLSAPLVLMRSDRRTLALSALALSVVCQLLSLTVDATPMLALLRTSCGFGEGWLYAAAIASLASTSAPDRAFGIVVAANQIAGTLLLATIAWISVGNPAAGAISVACIFSLATAPFVLSLPRGRDASSSGKDRATVAGFDRTPALLGLAGMFLLSAAFGLVWPNIGQIALARGVSQQSLLHAFSAVGLGGIAAGIMAAVLGAKFGRIPPLVVGSSGFAAALALPTTSSPFLLTALGIIFFFTLSVPYYLGLLAAIDRTGRLAVLTSAMIPFGIAVGQAASSFLVGSSGFANVTVVGSALATVALLAIVSAASGGLETRTALRDRPSAPAAP